MWSFVDCRSIWIVGLCRDLWALGLCGVLWTRSMWSCADNMFVEFYEL